MELYLPCLTTESINWIIATNSVRSARQVMYGPLKIIFRCSLRFYDMLEPHQHIGEEEVSRFDPCSKSHMCPMQKTYNLKSKVVS